VTVVVNLVGVNTLKAQNPDVAQIIYSREGLEFQKALTADEICNSFKMTTKSPNFHFDKPIFEPKLIGTSLMFNISDYRAYGGYCHTLPPLGNIEFQVNNATKLRIRGDDGNIYMNGGVFINNGIKSVNLGDAYGEDLAWGTSYIGFNAARKNGTWTMGGDGANNGGCAIWGNVKGTIYFASIPSTGTGSQTLTDVQIAQYVKLKLLSNGTLMAREVQVTALNYNWPDFVFEKDYSLMNLSETEAFIKENKHLPEIPSAKEIEENGLNLGEMQAKLLQKIEELTLHAIEQQKLIEELQKRLSELENKKGGE